MTHQGREFALHIAVSCHSVPVSEECPECVPEQALRADAATDRFGRRAARCCSKSSSLEVGQSSLSEHSLTVSTFDTRVRRSGKTAKGTHKRSLRAAPLDGIFRPNQRQTYFLPPPAGALLRPPPDGLPVPLGHPPPFPWPPLLPPPLLIFISLPDHYGLHHSLA